MDLTENGILKMEWLFCGDCYYDIALSIFSFSGSRLGRVSSRELSSNVSDIDAI